MITGLGYTFAESRSLFWRLSRAVIQVFYRFSLNNSRAVFFQNPEDKALFIQKKWIRSSQAVLVNGSGVDLDHFSETELPEQPVFLMICRLLDDKGVREYVSAAENVKKRFSHIRFFLGGDLDPNPNSIQESELLQWQKAGTVEYLGYLEDVRPAIQNCSCYVLPSYYKEGIPRTVLEAMSMGRPVITTDTPGCRETVALTPEGLSQKERGERVMNGENGFLVRVRDADALVNAMLFFVEKPGLAESMSKRSRKIAEEKFDVHKVNTVILNAMDLI
jgi:glycosyltransferase involved in cell wall biosynthesis